MLDLGSRDRWFEPHRKHCVVSLSKTFYPLLCTGLNQKIPGMTDKIVDWDIKHKHEQNIKQNMLIANNVDPDQSASSETG